MPATAIRTRKVYRRRKRYRGKGLNKKQAVAVKAIVNRKLNDVIEMKHHDVPMNEEEIGCFGVQATTYMYNLTSIAQSVTDTTRIGDSFILKSITGKLWFKIGTTPQVRQTVVRMILFQWKEDNNVAVPTYSDILQDPTGVPGSVLLPYKLDKNRKYKILYDKKFALSLNGDSDNILADLFVQKGFAKKIQYTNQGTTGLNQIYLLAVSSDDQGLLGQSELVNFTGRFRVRYQDA